MTHFRKRNAKVATTLTTTLVCKTGIQKEQSAARETTAERVNQSLAFALIGLSRLTVFLFRSSCRYFHRTMCLFVDPVSRRN